jgi:hypothetical protein
MENTERRIARRYVVQIPLNFRSLGSSQTPKHFGEMLDVSGLGVSFLTTTLLITGAAIEVYLKMPQEFLGCPSEWQWIGKVVYTRSDSARDKRTIVGVQFACGQSTEDSERQKNRWIAESQVTETKAVPNLGFAAECKTTEGIRRYSQFDMSGRQIR